jgi:hypothetical protein
MNYPHNIREEELKNKIATDFLGKYDCTEIIRDIDFAVKLKGSLLHEEYLLWAEAKSSPSDILLMLTQLVLTIGKARTFNEKLPPKFLGCFDCEKIAFIPYADIQDIFHQNDFNWKVAPSNRESKEFKLVYKQIDKIINSEEPYKAYCFKFSDENSLKLFILKNFLIGKSDVSKIRIDKNNFISIYCKWLETVKPTIQFDDWALAKKHGILDCDFYLADLISSENRTLKEKLFVVLKQTHYEMNRHKNEFGLLTSSAVDFTDKQKAHNAFWAIYERPPKEAYWDYITSRRDLLVPQDVRERKGSFYTPKIWVELSQKYLADVFGKDWQDEYYVWDCAAGTGNLLVGLANKYNIWASTLDQADVDVMIDRIKNGANLFENQVFQFDFLNDDFSKLPQGLQDIINDENKCKKLIIYINPPYAEAASYWEGANKVRVAAAHKTSEQYKEVLGRGINELFANFFIRIYNQIPNAKLASFSTLKYINSQNFIKFREYFLAKYKAGFVCKSSTFDNVAGHFPIGFLIWDLLNKKAITNIKTDIFMSNKDLTLCKKIGTKTFHAAGAKSFISDWLRLFFDNKNARIGYLRFQGTDFQTNNHAFFTSHPSSNDIRESKIANITGNNLIEMCIYLSVRNCIETTWINNRDQFLYPNDGWENDYEFQNDCLAFALFHGQNRISAKDGTNHWIPFIEWDVESHKRFDSHFMTDFFKGETEEFIAREPQLFYDCGKGGGGSGGSTHKKKIHRKFSKTTKDVFKAGKELWKYYHKQPKCNANASLYDIKEFFQGRNDKGKMNNKSEDEKYNELMGNLRLALKSLAEAIEPKVYEYGFLRE